MMNKRKQNAVKYLALTLTVFFAAVGVVNNEDLFINTIGTYALETTTVEK